MSKRRVFEVADQTCIYINTRSGKVCRAAVAMGSSIAMCDRHLRQHDANIEKIGESTPLQLPVAEGQAAL